MHEFSTYSCYMRTMLNMKEIFIAFFAAILLFSCNFSNNENNPPIENNHSDENNPVIKVEFNYL